MFVQEVLTFVTNISLDESFRSVKAGVIPAWRQRMCRQIRIIITYILSISTNTSYLQIIYKLAQLWLFLARFAQE